MLKRQYFNRFVLSAVVLILSVAACGSGDSGDFADSSAEFEVFDEAGRSFGIAVPAPQSLEASFDTAGDDAFFGADGFAEGEAAFAEERIVIKNGDITIVVADPAKSMDDISAMAVGMGGFVVYSNLYQTVLESGFEVPQANITIRVPAEQFLVALEQIEAGASRVMSKNESGQDVTREYTDLQSRLRNLENTEVQLREIMASADKTEDVLSVYRELSRISGEIELIKGQIQYFEQASALSAISVTLFADEAVQPLTVGGWQPVGVVKDAVQALINTLQTLATLAIWLTLYLLPILLLISLPVWLIWRRLKSVISQKMDSNTNTEAKE